MQATIVEHRISGIKVQLDDGSPGWLPHDELSYDPNFDTHDISTIHKEFSIGGKIDVIVLGEAVTDRSAVVSAAAAKHDPWKEEVPQWVPFNEIKVMVVTDIGHPEFYRGIIQPGVHARLARADFAQALGEQRASDPFFAPLPGDRLAGRVTGADSKDRVVTLSANMLFRGPAPLQGQKREGAKSLLASPETALALLSKIPESFLRARLEPAWAAAGLSLASSNSPHIQYHRVLVLDDDPHVTDSIARFLRAQGCDPVACTSAAEARTRLGLGLSEDQEPSTAADIGPASKGPVNLALIDVNLEPGGDSAANGGIEFAKELHYHRPSCRIVLMTAEPMTVESCERKARKAQGLPLYGLADKPLPKEVLLDLLGGKTMASPCDGAVLFRRPAAGIRSALLHEPTCGTAQERIEKRRRQQIEKLLETVRKELQADSAFVFRMHPVTYETYVVAEAGLPLGNKEKYLQKLRYSPVADVCSAHGADAQAWYDEDAQSSANFGRHRYLLYCYSHPERHCPKCANHHEIGCPDHRYRSCCAAQVAGGPGDPFAYCLFILARRPGAFIASTVTIRAELAAAATSKINLEARLSLGAEEDFGFLMAGRSACTLGHDLCNQFQFVIDFDTAIKQVADMLERGATPSQLAELSDTLTKAKAGMGFAHDIAKRFRDLATTQSEPESDFTVSELLAGKGGAVALSAPERASAKVEVLAFDDTPAQAMHTVLHARKNALLRVFQNILSNPAQQMVFRGVLSGRIKMRAYKTVRPSAVGPTKPGVVIDVFDTGPGIHWRDRDNIFLPRFTTRPSGSGMGLHIAREELERAGGTVTLAESILGLGSCLTIFLPAALDVKHP